MVLCETDLCEAVTETLVADARCEYGARVAAVECVASCARACALAVGVENIRGCGIPSGCVRSRRGSRGHRRRAPAHLLLHRAHRRGPHGARRAILGADGRAETNRGGDGRDGWLAVGRAGGRPASKPWTRRAKRRPVPLGPGRGRPRAPRFGSRGWRGTAAPAAGRARGGCCPERHRPTRGSRARCWRRRGQTLPPRAPGWRWTLPRRRRFEPRRASSWRRACPPPPRRTR